MKIIAYNIIRIIILNGSEFFTIEVFYRAKKCCKII